MHRNPHHRFAPIALAVLLTVSAVGCGSGNEESGDNAAGGPFGNGDQVDPDTDAGSSDTGSTELPDSWPADVALPGGVEIRSAQSTLYGSTITATTDLSVDDVMAFYTGALDGWTVISEFAGDDAASETRNANAQYERDAETVAVGASSSDDMTVISVDYVDQSDS